MGMLIGLIGPNVLGQVDRARVTTAKADLATLAQALDMYKLDNHFYPTTDQGLEALVSAPSGSGAAQWNGPYLDKLPSDPYGVQYQYLNPGTHGKQVEVFTLGLDNVQGGEGSDKDWGNWNLD